MPQSYYHPSLPSPPPESIPPIPPRTRSRPPSRQRQTIPLPPNHSKTFFFRLDDLTSPDREWQLFENIGDGTYGEVFRVSSVKCTFLVIIIACLGEKYSQSGF
jgi:hypothetical protein